MDHFRGRDRRSSAIFLARSCSSTLTCFLNSCASSRTHRRNLCPGPPTVSDAVRVSTPPFRMRIVAGTSSRNFGLMPSPRSVTESTRTSTIVSAAWSPDAQWRLGIACARARERQDRGASRGSAVPPRASRSRIPRSTSSGDCAAIAPLDRAGRHRDRRDCQTQGRPNEVGSWGGWWEQHSTAGAQGNQRSHGRRLTAGGHRLIECRRGLADAPDRDSPEYTVRFLEGHPHTRQATCGQDNQYQGGPRSQAIRQTNS